MRPLLLSLLTACATAPSLTAADCTTDEVFTTECGGCGPTDACLDPQPVCAPTCDGDFTPCDDEGGVCLDGRCLHNVCG